MDMHAGACWLYIHIPAGSDRDWPLSLASSTALRNISTTRGPLFRTSSGGNSRGLPRTFRPVRVVRRPETVIQSIWQHSSLRGGITCSIIIRNKCIAKNVFMYIFFFRYKCRAAFSTVVALWRSGQEE